MEFVAKTSGIREIVRVHPESLDGTGDNRPQMMIGRRFDQFFAFGTGIDPELLWRLCGNCRQKLEADGRWNVEADKIDRLADRVQSRIGGEPFDRALVRIDRKNTIAVFVIGSDRLVPVFASIVRRANDCDRKIRHVTARIPKCDATTVQSLK